LDTVNANAWGGAFKYTLNSAADVVLVQETKTRPGYSTEAAEQSARNAKWNVSIQACHETQAGGCSAGVAIGVRNHIGMSSSIASEASKHLHPAGRFCLKRVAAGGKGGMQCGSIYCYSMAGGITAKPNLDLLESVAHTLKSLKGCWIIGGDWNCTPAQLLATGWPAKVGGIIKAPAAATCNDSTYDYFVVARELDSAVMGVHVIGDAGLTPTRHRG
jgi:exonuclease III